MRKDLQLALSIIAGFLFLAGLLTLTTLSGTTPVSAGGIPTPIANLPGQSPDAVLVTFLNEDINTSDAGGPAIQIYTAEYCYMQYIIDQTAGNTTTLTVQYSMDANNWVSGASLVSGNTSDDSGILQVPVYARYLRIYEDHTGSNAITTTVKALCK